MRDQKGVQKAGSKGVEGHKKTSDVELSPHATFDELADYFQRRCAAGETVKKCGGDSSFSN